MLPIARRVGGKVIWFKGAASKSIPAGKGSTMSVHMFSTAKSPVFGGNCPTYPSCTYELRMIYSK